VFISDGRADMGHFPAESAATVWPVSSPWRNLRSSERCRPACRTRRMCTSPGL